jgi:hypothetical protein
MSENIVTARVGRSGLWRDLAIEYVGSHLVVAGLRVRLAGTYSSADEAAAHFQTASEVGVLGHAADAYALLSRPDSVGLLVPAAAPKTPYDRANALLSLGLEAEPGWEDNSDSE